MITMLCECPLCALHNAKCATHFILIAITWREKASHGTDVEMPVPYRE